MLTFNERGDRLVRLERTSRGADVERYGTITHAVVLARVPGGLLLVRSRRRGCWELPGGMRDGSESPQACAARELWEETGIGPVVVRPCAVMILDLQPSCRNPTRREECGAVFRTDHPRMPAPFESHEIAGLAVRPADRLPPETGALDAHLVRALWAGAER